MLTIDSGYRTKTWKLYFHWGRLLYFVYAPLAWNQAKHQIVHVGSWSLRPDSWWGLGGGGEKENGKAWEGNAKNISWGLDIKGEKLTHKTGRNEGSGAWSKDERRMHEAGRLSGNGKRPALLESGCDSWERDCTLSTGRENATLKGESRVLCEYLHPLFFSLTN